MHLFEKRPVFPWKGLVVTVVVFAAVMLLFSWLLGSAGSTADKEQTALLETALRNAAVTKYSVQGSYPESLDKLVSEYGIIVDESRFLVRYDVFAPNIMPEISVVVKGETDT